MFILIGVGFRVESWDRGSFRKYIETRYFDMAGYGAEMDLSATRAKLARVGEAKGFIKYLQDYQSGFWAISFNAFSKSSSSSPNAAQFP